MISLPFVIRPPPTSVATARPTTHITFITLRPRAADTDRSEEHTSELQSRSDLVCRLLLEKKKKNQRTHCDCLGDTMKMRAGRDGRMPAKLVPRRPDGASCALRTCENGACMRQTRSSTALT